MKIDSHWRRMNSAQPSSATSSGSWSYTSQGYGGAAASPRQAMGWAPGLALSKFSFNFCLVLSPELSTRFRIELMQQFREQQRIIRARQGKDQKPHIHTGPVRGNRPVIPIQDKIFAGPSPITRQYEVMWRRAGAHAGNKPLYILLAGLARKIPPRRSIFDGDPPVIPVSPVTQRTVRADVPDSLELAYVSDGPGE